MKAGTFLTILEAALIALVVLVAYAWLKGGGIASAAQSLGGGAVKDATQAAGAVTAPPSGSTLGTGTGDGTPIPQAPATPGDPWDVFGGIDAWLNNMQNASNNAGRQAHNGIVGWWDSFWRWASGGGQQTPAQTALGKNLDPGHYGLAGPPAPPPK